MPYIFIEPPTSEQLCFGVEERKGKQKTKQKERRTFFLMFFFFLHKYSVCDVLTSCRWSFMWNGFSTIALGKRNCSCRANISTNIALAVHEIVCLTAYKFMASSRHRKCCMTAKFDSFDFAYNLASRKSSDCLFIPSHSGSALVVI